MSKSPCAWCIAEGLIEDVPGNVSHDICERHLSILYPAPEPLTWLRFCGELVNVWRQHVRELIRDLKGLR